MFPQKRSKTIFVSESSIYSLSIAPHKLFSRSYEVEEVSTGSYNVARILDQGPDQRNLVQQKLSENSAVDRLAVVLMFILYWVSELLGTTLYLCASVYKTYSKLSFLE